MKSYLVTGGCGFLGSALVRRLVQEGHRVRVLDNDSRGEIARLNDIAGGFEYVMGDVRDADAVKRAVEGVDSVCHFAFVNGTEFFYTKPNLVLDVAVKGIVNVLEACQRFHVPEFALASSSEVYQDPPVIPTDEAAPLSIPDPLNPRYCYAAGKIISEIMTLNMGRAQFKRLLIIRPHNVYGPAMGWEHVIPQFLLRMHALNGSENGTIAFPIQGDGHQTRSFVFVSDFIDGLMAVLRRGEHMGIYNVGTPEEIAIGELARMVAELYGRRIQIVPSPALLGGAKRRCPDIAKVTALGYQPRFSLREGLKITAKWYDENFHRAPAQAAAKEA